MTNIAKNLTQVYSQIDQAAKNCGRDSREITLLAVSKTKPAAAIREAHEVGQRQFGENYLQEALAKIAELADLDIEWHFIGRIQSNKTRDIAAHFHWVHALASLKHAQRLNEQRPAELPPLQACIQVNITGEASKGGVSEANLPELARKIAQLPNLRLRGLMTMPDPNDPPAVQRTVFSRLRELQQELNAKLGLTLDTLSMGMSDDLEAAVAEGSTLVRIGTAIFGARDYAAGDN